ncbi:PREDICTED: uncharacterized protein LOC100638670 [Amphimedon queenslandica]|uniref:DUF4371 domain-containing protein n=1 Tax=Amphimedon queenslandica TaxID=400682 RepID=A0AAN0JSF8_AMPQE|nr:PREDICTED: uncharacterized protein LOC100638670 [Amphimedon queenslandica]|eukprot:XP_019859751.1 PREDICTED: uncharacterized protein LOC100638670 [Amphimedon queenslandica]
MYNLYSNETEPDNETQQSLNEASHCQTETPQAFDDEQSTSSQDPPTPLSEGLPPVKQPRVCHTDLGTFLPTVSAGRTAVTDHDKFCLIEEHFVPEPSCNLHNFEHNPSAQHGNFLALLQFRIAAGDTVLKEHLLSGSVVKRNATYTSYRIQNEILDILGNIITQKIVTKIEMASYYSIIIADKVTDCSNKEQLAIVLRCVNADDNVIHEDLLAFLECDSGITGSALSQKIISFLVSLGLDLSKLRDQAYDGAGNMSGSLKGTAALIFKDHPLALYLHCASHNLNLAVVKCLDERSISNMIGTVEKVSIFFSAHPKRQRKLEDSIDNTLPAGTLPSRVKKLKDLCRTRWVERIDALDWFWKLLPCLVSCFEAISNEGSSKWSRLLDRCQHPFSGHHNN